MDAGPGAGPAARRSVLAPGSPRWMPARGAGCVGPARSASGGSEAKLRAARVFDLTAAAVVVVVARVVMADHTDKACSAVVVGVALVGFFVVLVTAGDEQRQCYGK